LEAIVAQTRVHELAKEFGVDSKTILEKLRGMGEFIKGPASVVPMPIEMRLRQALHHQGMTPVPHPKPRYMSGFGRVPIPYERRRPPSSSRRPAPPPDQNLLDASRIFGVPVEELKPAKEERPRGRYASSESRRSLTAWEEHWIDGEERREWMNAGLGPDDGRIAGQLKDRGIKPDDLLLRVDGVRLNERLRGGESIGSIVARLNEYRRNRDAG
jgi:hypothetical protein